MSNFAITHPNETCHECDNACKYYYCKKCCMLDMTHSIHPPACRYCAVNRKCTHCIANAYGSCSCCGTIICHFHSNEIVINCNTSHKLLYLQERGFTYKVICDNCVIYRAPSNSVIVTQMNYKKFHSRYIRLIMRIVFERVNIYDKNFINVYLRDIFTYLHLKHAD